MSMLEFAASHPFHRLVRPFLSEPLRKIGEWGGGGGGGGGGRVTRLDKLRHAGALSCTRKIDLARERGRAYYFLKRI